MAGMWGELSVSPAQKACSLPTPSSLLQLRRLPDSAVESQAHRVSRSQEGGRLPNPLKEGGGFVLHVDSD